MFNVCFIIILLPIASRTFKKISSYIRMYIHPSLFVGSCFAVLQICGGFPNENASLKPFGGQEH